MCGICGWLNFKNELDSQTFVKMNNIAKYRGPDDEGYVAVSPIAWRTMSGKDSCPDVRYDGNMEDYQPSDGNDFLFLGHRRLSIIDLSTNGHQPMQSESHRLCITFNGEIYNYIELREELRELGYEFKTNTDTEVILKSYAQWGEACVEHFNGMWAFAIWDAIQHKLFCSRDRLGAKPFYYYKGEDEFIFASEIKQLCENPNIIRTLNESILVTQIMWGITDFSDETLIKDIKSLQGGCNLTVFLDNCNSHIQDIRINSYWDVDVSAKEKVDDTLFEVLEDAIRLRTRSDVPVGALLSGGLDSSCVVAQMAEVYDKKGKKRESISTFTSCYNDFQEGDEQEFARMVNEHCGTKQNFVYPDAQDTYSVFEDMIWHLEGEGGFAVIGSYLLLGEISKTDIKVLLNGQGSDETMFGYERYYATYFRELLNHFEWRQAIYALKDASRNSRLSIKQLVQYFVYFSCKNIRKKRCYYRMNEYVTEHVKREFNSNSTVDKFIVQKDMRTLQYNELRGTQLPHILRMDDRLYMAHSLESRVPYIDYRYIEKAVKIPEREKIQHGYTKYLLRKHFENKLPAQVIWRKNKMGWPSPEARWVERFDGNKVDDLFDNARTKKYFNTTNLKALYQKEPTAYPIERFMTAEIFVRKFKVEVP